jgi:hypothetical protein
MVKTELVYIIRKEIGYETQSHELIPKLSSRYHDIKELNINQALNTDISSAKMLIVDAKIDDYNTIVSLKNIL